MSVSSFIQGYAEENKFKILDRKITMENFDVFYLKSKKWFSEPFIVLVHTKRISVPNIQEKIQETVKKIDALSIDNMSFLVFFDIEPSQVPPTEPSYFFSDKTLSFIHIIFRQDRTLYWDKDFYYHGDKEIKKLLADIEAKVC